MSDLPPTTTTDSNPRLAQPGIQLSEEERRDGWVIEPTSRGQIKVLRDPHLKKVLTDK